jgi:3-hydroxyisobutyrate dehydrogenase-like beta-hydroxyacid dehydrogenase
MAHGLLGGSMTPDRTPAPRKEIAMSNVAFLGLGLMGSQMARRLAETGNDLTVWNRTKERAERLADVATVCADSPAAAVKGAQYVVTMLATPQAVEEVAFGEGGMAAVLTPGQVWIDMSTIGPEEFRDATARLPEGVVAVDAPVRGSVPEATEGRLQIFVGADTDVFDRVEALIAPLGTVRHVGPPGAGASMKLVVNLALVSTMVVFGEAVTLGRALGLDQSAVMDVLAESPIGPTVRAKRANLETSSYPPSFKLVLATKDIVLVDDAAATAGLDLPVAAAVRVWMEDALAQGAGDLDFSAVAEAIASEAPGKGKFRDVVPPVDPSANNTATSRL